MSKDGISTDLPAALDVAALAQTRAAPAEACLVLGDARYYPYTAAFTAADGEEIEVTHHFKEPGRSHIIQLAKAGQAKGFDAQHNLLRQLVHPDEKAGLEDLLGRKPLLVVAFADEVFKRAGAGAVFAGK